MARPLWGGIAGHSIPWTVDLGTGRGFLDIRRSILQIGGGAYLVAVDLVQDGTFEGSMVDTIRQLGEIGKGGRFSN